MSRSLKVVGLLFLVGLAVVAVVAAGAMAEEEEGAGEGPYFRTEDRPAQLTGKELGTEHVFITSAGTTECSSVKLGGIVNFYKSEAAFIGGTYSGCTLNKETATVEFGLCTWVPRLNEGSSPPTATVELTCPSELTIKTAKCTIHFGASQKELPHVQFTNTTLKADVDFEFHVHALTYTATAGCPGGQQTKSDGEYKDEVTFQADDANKTPVAFKVE